MKDKEECETNNDIAWQHGYAKEVELKPCPFCGGKGLPQSHPGNPMTTGWFHSIECQSCFGGTFHYADTKEKAIEAWNKRPQNKNAEIIAGICPECKKELFRDNNAHKCTCNRHPDSAFTVRVKNDIPYCPRCGGIVWPKIGNNALVPLDFELVKIFFQDRWTYLENEVGASTTTLTIYRGLIEILQVVCEKFSQQPPKERKVSLEEIERRISFSDLWISHPQRPQGHKRHLAQAILSLLNSTEEREGA